MMYYLETKKKKIINQNINTYSLMICFEDTKIIIDGYMDSGNDSIYKNKPIIYLNKKYKNNQFITIGITPITTVNGVELHKIYTASKVIFEKREIDVCFAFVDLEKRDCLLNMRII